MSGEKTPPKPAPAPKPMTEKQREDLRKDVIKNPGKWTDPPTNPGGSRH